MVRRLFISQHTVKHLMVLQSLASITYKVISSCSGFAIIFQWVGFIISNDVRHFYIVICLLMRSNCSIDVLKVALRMRTKHFPLYFLLVSFFFWLPAALHFILSCFSRPPWSQISYSSHPISSSSSPLHYACFLPASRSSNPLSPTLLSLLLSLPW